MTFLSFSERYGKELDDQRKFMGYLLAALYLRGIDKVEITREFLEDEVWTGVTLHRTEDMDTSSFTFKWRVQGMMMPLPTAPKATVSKTPVAPPAKVEEPLSVRMHWFAYGMIAGAALVVLGVGMGAMLR